MTQSFKIERAEARIVFDSRGSQTVEVELGSGSVSYSVAAPAGKSRGGREVQAYPSNGVAEAVKAFREMVRPRLLGADPADQRAIDGMLAEIDGTGGFSRIGGNTAYSVSICSAGLASRLAGKPLWEHVAKLSGLRPSIPIPLGNVLGGGAHAGRGAPDIQEILVFHTAAETPFEAVAENIAVHRRVGEKLSEMLPDYGGGKGDEGAYAPPLDDETALKAVKESAGGLVAVGLDVAANSIYISGRKVYRYRRLGEMERARHIQYIEGLATSYGLKYLEDPVEEGDWDGFRELRSRLPGTLICGDDLVVTRADLIREAAASGAINAVILKPNQVGTLSATLDAAAEAERWKVVKVVSHRSGETCDSSLAHIAVGVGANLIKSGVVGGERVAKANELLRIWERAAGRLEMSRVAAP